MSCLTKPERSRICEAEYGAVESREVIVSVEKEL